jgi:Protein of unknown function (DUF732)
MASGAGNIWAVAAPRKVARVGAAALAVAALAAVPGAHADPPPGCFHGPGPQPTPGCAIRAFVTDMNAAGLKDSRGNTVAVDQALDMCGLMDGGLSPQEMANNFLSDNPGLGPNGATQVVTMAINDLCPWHR